MEEMKRFLECGGWFSIVMAMDEGFAMTVSISGTDLTMFHYEML
jgi:hypothetical protein